MFSVICSRHICAPQRNTEYTEPYKFEQNVSANNVRMKHRTDLRLGEIIYFLIFYHI